MATGRLRTYVNTECADCGRQVSRQLPHRHHGLFGLGKESKVIWVERCLRCGHKVTKSDKECPGCYQKLEE